MITADPYGISGAVAPWRSLDAMEPVAERKVDEWDAEKAKICERCPLPDCYTERAGCLLRTKVKSPDHPVICWNVCRWTGMGRRR